MSEKLREAVFTKFDEQPGVWFVQLYEEPWRCVDKTFITSDEVDEAVVPFEVSDEIQCNTMYVLQRLPDHLVRAALDLLEHGVGLCMLPEVPCES